ncbi:MAG: hypothetical protein IJ181_06495 [Acidaminococcaceae bacterium]|nr:hypothetical protein [Acidaminococcaceae bacterium]
MRKEKEEIQIQKKILLGTYFSAVNIDNVGERLKGKEADSDRDEEGRNFRKKREKGCKNIVEKSCVFAKKQRKQREQHSAEKQDAGTGGAGKKQATKIGNEGNTQENRKKLEAETGIKNQGNAKKNGLFVPGHGIIKQYGTKQECRIHESSKCHRSLQIER